MNKVKELIELAGNYQTLSDKIDKISKKLLESPYAINPLIGSAEKTEQFTCDLDSFDCVTLVETVLAIVLSKTSSEFEENLKKIRYKEGNVEWISRNHYFSEWFKENNKILNDFVSSDKKISIQRSLSCLDNYPVKEVSLEFIPVPEIEKIKELIQTGDIIAFGTTQEDLDLRHVGFLIKKQDLILRHATKALNSVVDEKLSDFIQRFGDCPGIMLRRVSILTTI